MITIKQVELIMEKEFTSIALHIENRTYIVYMASITIFNFYVHLSW